MQSLDGENRDVQKQADQANQDTISPERDMYLWTNIPVSTIDDAIVVSLCYLKRWKIETVFYFLKQVFDLEKICILKLEKIKNLCALLIMAANYLYESFAECTKEEVAKTDRSLESMMEEGDEGGK